MTSTTIPRWGLGACFVVWATGLAGAIVGGGIGAAVLGFEEGGPNVGVLIAGLVVQTVAVVGAAVLVVRTRGRGSLRSDVGFEVRARDAVWILAGAGLQIVVGILLVPITLLSDTDEAQGVVEAFSEASHGAEIAVFAVAVVVLAPLAEEVLFRGLLLRALLRRTSAGAAVLWSAVVFAAVHVVLDPTLGSALALPALLALGLVAGDQAVRTRSLSRPILLHVGFNLLTVVGLLTL